MNLKEKVRNLTSSPGVYLMKDSHGGIIYVGKAKNLKKRVQSYFQNSKSYSPKVEKLINHLKDFDYIMTDTEFEAFMLECKLIQDLKPIYNKKMKSPLSYSYIVIRRNKDYPKIEVINDDGFNDNDIYFGPFTNKNTVERALQGIKEHFKIICSNPSKKDTSCLNYSMDLCIGMCLGGAELEKYNDIIGRIISLLSGNDMGILEEMKNKMLYASERFDFETAAKYRDYIDLVHYLISRGKVIEFTEKNKNILMIETLDECTIKFFLIKGNKILFSEKYILDCSNFNELNSMIKAKILVHFKFEELNSSIQISKDKIDEAQIIYSYLQNNNCSFIIIPDECVNSENLTALDEGLEHFWGNLNKEIC